MLRLRATAALVAVLQCLASTAFSGDPSQEIGFRQPGVRDWRVFHRNNDEYWARMVTATTGWWDSSTKGSKIRLTGSEVRRMRILAGIPDDDPSDSILEVAGRGMKADQYLFVAIKPDGCLNVSVFGNGWHLKQLWSIDKLSNGSDICRQPACPEPQVSVDDKHEINIMIFSRSAPANPFCDQYNSASFVPKGDSFELKEQDTGATTCSLSNAHWSGLNLALRQAAGSGETLAIVESLPSLSQGLYALVLQGRSNGVSVLRMLWERKGGPDAESSGPAWDCFAHAKSIPMSVATLDIPQDRASSLLVALKQIDLRSDRCFRNADQECAMLLDGRRFSVQVGNNPPIRLTDVKGLRGYTSENPRLSDWVYKLLDEASHAKRISGNQP